MNINRNVLKIVAGALLAAALPAGAQVLGGGGALNGALGGGIGQGIHGDGGIMGNGSLDTPDVTSKAGKVRERAKEAGQRAKDAATNTAGAARSKVEKVGSSANANANGTAAASATKQDGGVLFNGSTAAGASKQMLGRDVTANGGAASTGSASRTGLNNSTAGQAGLSVQKSAPAETPPAQ